MAANILECLGVADGIACAIGAGGKKTLLYRMAEACSGRVAITNTVYAAPVPETLGAVQIQAPAEELEARVGAADGRRLAYTLPETKPGRTAGVPPALITTIHRAAGLTLTLVKADGARMRWIKAPAPGEPVLPPETDTVFAILSARALGEPLGERIAHRPDAVADVAGIAPGDVVTPEVLARLMVSERGVARPVAGARVVPVINMVDNPEREYLARSAACCVLEQSDRFDRVVLTRLKDRRQPVVDVIRS